MNTFFSTNLRNNRAMQIALAIDNNQISAGKLYVYGSLRPETGGDPVTPNTYLALFRFQKPCTTAQLVVNGVLTFSAIPPATVIREGTVLWCRVTDADDNFVMDGDAGDLNSTAPFKFSNLDVTVGGTLSCTLTSITEGNHPV